MNHKKGIGIIWIISIVIVLIIVIIGLYFIFQKKNGNDVNNLDMSNKSKVSNFQSCDDNNVCTIDNYDSDNKICINNLIIPCCGNNVCEKDETISSCPIDCKCPILEGIINSDVYKSPIDGDSVIDFNEYKNSQYEIDFANAVPAVNIGNQKYRVSCRRGSKVGENPNYYYCGNRFEEDITPLLIFDENGIIQKQYNIQLIVDSISKKTVEVKCIN
jgi:hypothetical protein